MQEIKTNEQLDLNFKVHKLQDKIFWGVSVEPYSPLLFLNNVSVISYLFPQKIQKDNKDCH